MAASQQRSRSYPVADLKEAVELIRKLLDAVGTGEHERSTLAVALGYSGSSGGVARQIAALVQYGLLRINKKRYRATSFGLELLTALDDGDEQVALGILRQCFLSAPLFAEVVEAYRPKGRLPTLLAYTLESDHGITAAAKHDVAKVLARSGEFAQVFEADGSFTADFRDEARTQHAKQRGIEPGTPSNGRTDPREVEMLSIPVLLTGGKIATFHVPKDLTDKDLSIIELQMELFRRQVESNRIAPRLDLHRGGERHS